ncbi:RusA family crossover junction endodeoxyribonuclease, partial [Lactobacillus jensenii]|uniref:RusA family crossover junction endodeoxyribonuclease n=1 Tax=Lactobacillus jensenii TaxID=109790 RepID=UPI002870422D
HRGYVQTYDPAKSRQYKAMASMCAQRVYSGEPQETPLKITVKAYLGLYKSYTKKSREACLSGEEGPTKKPDIDNIVKGIMDSLN